MRRADPLTGATPGHPFGAARPKRKPGGDPRRGLAEVTTGYSSRPASGSGGVVGLDRLDRLVADLVPATESRRSAAGFLGGADHDTLLRCEAVTRGRLRQMPL